MRTDITITTSRGKAKIVLGPDQKFSLKGSDEAIEEISGFVPVIDNDENSIDIFPDVITRLAVISQNSQEGPVSNAIGIESHREMQEMTFTENPVILFQVRPPNWESEIEPKLKDRLKSGDLDHSSIETIKESLWVTDGVFMSKREADGFIQAQKYRYSEDQRDSVWRFYTSRAVGTLKRVIKDARDLEHQ